MPRWLLLSPSCPQELVCRRGRQAKVSFSASSCFDRWHTSVIMLSPWTTQSWDSCLLAERWSKRSLKLQQNESVETVLNFIKVFSFVLNHPGETRLLHLQAQNSLWLYSTSLPSSLNLCNWLSVFDPISSMINFVLRHAVPKSNTPHDPTNGRGKLSNGRTTVDKQLNTETKLYIEGWSVWSPDEECFRGGERGELLRMLANRLEFLFSRLGLLVFFF